MCWKAEDSAIPIVAFRAHLEMRRSTSVHIIITPTKITSAWFLMRFMSTFKSDTDTILSDFLDGGWYIA